MYRFEQSKWVLSRQIDVEGAEMDVLAGIDSTTWSRIRQVVMEVTDMAGRVSEACRILEEQAFDDVNVDQAEGVPAYMVYARRTTT